MRLRLYRRAEGDGGKLPADTTSSNRQGGVGSGNDTERSDGALTLIALRAKD